MQRTIIHLLSLIVCCAVIPSLSAAEKKPGMRKVFLYHQATREIKGACTEIMGKHDAAPSYECLDPQTGKQTPIALGTEWKSIIISPVCMKNRATGVVKRNCFKYESGMGREYLEVIPETGEYVALDKKWAPLSLDDPLCLSPVFEKDDPIKQFEFNVIMDLEQPVKKRM